jgi:hypothetical protein
VRVLSFLENMGYTVELEIGFGLEYLTDKIFPSIIYFKVQCDLKQK